MREGFASPPRQMGRYRPPSSAKIHFSGYTLATFYAILGTLRRPRQRSVRRGQATERVSFDDQSEFSTGHQRDARRIRWLFPSSVIRVRIPAFSSGSTKTGRLQYTWRHRRSASSNPAYAGFRSRIGLSIFDAQIAAIAVTHDLTVVTRNVKHFVADYFPGLRTANPWT